MNMMSCITNLFICSTLMLSWFLLPCLSKGEILCMKSTAVYSEMKPKLNWGFLWDEIWIPFPSLECLIKYNSKICILFFNHNNHYKHSVLISVLCHQNHYRKRVLQSVDQIQSMCDLFLEMLHREDTIGLLMPVDDQSIWYHDIIYCFPIN